MSDDQVRTNKTLIQIIKENKIPHGMYFEVYKVYVEPWTYEIKNQILYHPVCKRVDMEFIKGFCELVASSGSI